MHIHNLPNNYVICKQKLSTQNKYNDPGVINGDYGFIFTTLTKQKLKLKYLNIFIIIWIYE